MLSVVALKRRSSARPRPSRRRRVRPSDHADRPRAERTAVGCMDRSSPAGLALALVLGSPPRKLLVVQHPAEPLWAGSRTALVAVGGAVLWWAVSCRVLLDSLRLGAGRSFSGVNFSFRALSVGPVPLEASIGAANPGLCVEPFLQTTQPAAPRDALRRGFGARVPHRLGVRLGRRRAVASAGPSSGQVFAVDPVGCTLLAMRQRL